MEKELTYEIKMGLAAQAASTITHLLEHADVPDENNSLLNSLLSKEYKVLVEIISRPEATKYTVSGVLSHYISMSIHWIRNSGGHVNEWEEEICISSYFRVIDNN